MKDDLNIPLPRQKDSVVANMRRDKYSLTRDMQALEFNTAIVNNILQMKRIGGSVKNAVRNLKPEQKPKIWLFFLIVSKILTVLSKGNN